LNFSSFDLLPAAFNVVFVLPSGVARLMKVGQRCRRRRRRIEWRDAEGNEGVENVEGVSASPAD